MPKRYPRTLSTGAHNTVIALSETEAGKVFAGDTRSEIGAEAEKMRAANAVNGLVVGFVRLDISEELDADMLVMERLGSRAGPWHPIRSRGLPRLRARASPAVAGRVRERAT